MSSPEHKQKIWNIINDIKVGMLVTQDEDDLRGRPMYIVQKEYDGTLWFFTHKSDAKVYEAQDDRHVCITFSGDDAQVSLSGWARLDFDQDRIDEYWNPFVAAWFDGREDPEIALLKIKIYQGEHWESGNTIKQLYEVAKANVTEDKPDMGDNQKFG